MMHRARGFTLVELIMVIVMLGVLAVMALPKMDSIGIFRGASFHDSVVAALRFAQKTATSHRRLVCVAFTPTKVTLTIALANPGTCGTSALNFPGANCKPDDPPDCPNSVISRDATNAVFDPLPATLYFQPDGRGTSDAAGATAVDPLDVLISGQATIKVYGATGYVDPGYVQ